MTYGAFLIGHPLFWSTLVGTGLGAALASSTLISGRDRRPDRARSRKWTSTALWATFAVIAATCGIFIPDGAALIALPSLHVAGGTLAFVALALRFPRAGGIPAFFIIAATAVLSPLVMRPYVPVRDESVVATVQLLAVDQSGAYLELNDRTPDAGSRTPAVILAPTPTIVAQAHALQISDYLFFFGATGGIALRGFQSAQTRSADNLYAATPFMERVIGWLPLLTRTEVESEPVRLNVLQVYEIIGMPGGSIQLREAATSE
jgi:hypothetical protein